jgi:hypothetical protein
MGRAERRERWEAAFNPTRLALTGVALSVLVLLQPGNTGRLVILVLAAVAAMVSGRKLSPLTTMIVMAGIIAANLLVPLGRVLLEWGPVTITELALHDGLRKALTFEALMFISKACLGPNLRLPGRFGSFFADALRWYDKILEQKKTVRLATFLADIDAILVSIHYTGIDATTETDSRHLSGARLSDVVLALAVIVAMIPVLVR